MKYRSFQSKVRCTWALVLALSLFWNGWSNYDMSVYAAESSDNDESAAQAVTGITVSLGKTEEEYTGQNMIPVVTVKDSEDTDVTADSDISWENERGEKVSELVDAGTYTCKVSFGADGNGFTDDETFRILPRPLSSDGVRVELSPESVIFDNQAHSAGIIADDNGRALIQDTDYNVDPASEEYTDEGEYTITITGMGNYTGEIKKKFVIAVGSAADEDIRIEESYYVPGNYSGTVEVNNIDVIPPAFDSIEDGKEYYISEKNASVAFKVSDEGGSGIAKVSCKEALSAETELSDNDGIYSISEPGNYTVRAADYAGNETSVRILIKKDTQAPLLELDSAVNDAGYTAKTSSDSYLFKGSLNVTLAVTDEPGTGESDQAPITVIRISESGSRAEVVPDAQGNYIDTISTEGTYTYSVADDAGNSDENSDVTITAEKITQNKLEGDISYENTPVKITEGGHAVDCFHALVKPVFYADFSADENIIRVEYSSDGGNSFTSVYSQVTQDNVCTLGKELTERVLEFDGAGGLDDGSYSYIFKVTDAVGTEQEYNFDFKVDKTAPESTVYVVYDSDIADPMEAAPFADTMNREVFGQNKVDYYLLVKDGIPDAADDPYISGISNENMTVSSKDNKITVSEPVLCEDIQAMIFGSVYGDYSVFKGTLELPDNTDPASAFDSLEIEKLTDRAGNTALAEGIPIHGDTVIFIDHCPPGLSIDYGDADSYTEGTTDDVPCIYYKDSAALTLDLDEDFYEKYTKDGEAVQPDVTLTKTVDGQTEEADVPDWETVRDEKCEARLKLNLAAQAGKEVIYNFTVTYQDGSQNKLNTASDCKGVLQDGTFTSTAIVIDHRMPEITEVHIAEDTEDLDPEEKSILTKNNVTVTAVVKDAFLNRVALLKDGKDSEIAPDDGYPKNDGTYSWTISADTYLKGEYQIAAKDTAGNETMSDVLFVEIDKTAPQIESGGISIDTEELAAAHDKWIKEDTTFTITVVNDNRSSASPGIRYRKMGENTIYEAGEGVKDQDGKWVFTVEEKDDTFSGSYEFQAYDALKNGKDDNGIWMEFEFHKDKVLPDIDRIEAEYAGYEEDTGKLSRGIFAKALDTIRETEFGEKLYERLFVKSRIQVTLYLQDEISGVKEVTCEYGGKIYGPIQTSGSAKDGLYDVVRFELEGENADMLKIIKIEDRAGNVADCSTKPELTEKGEGTSLLVIDGTAPTLSVVYADCTGKEEDKKRRYYRQAEDRTYEKVILTFTEQYLDKQVDMKTGKVILPEVTVYKNGTGETGNMKDYLADGSSWNFDSWDRGDGTISAELWLPYSSAAGGEEIEYTITAFYQDGSKNLLSLHSATDSFGEMEKDSGTYKSGTLILDNKAPELTRYRMKGTSNHQADGVDVYRNVTGDDVTVTFTVDDNAEYWDAAAVHVSVVDVTNERTLASSSPDVLGGSNLKDFAWTENGNLHTASFGFDGEEEKESEYEVRISYADRAGNKLIMDAAAEGILTEGTYASAPFILDHVAPVFNITFGRAFRLTDSENKDYTGSEKTPVAGMTSYYGQAQGKVDIQVTIDETYLARDEEKANKIADFAFCVNGTDTAMDWKKSGTVYTGTYSVTEDGDYKISVSYQDAAGNKMTDGDTVQGGTVKDGSYTSPMLILDTVAPVVTRAYTSAPVNVYKGRQYFGKNTTLKIRVQDENIRYKELRDPLLKMTAADISGTKIKDTRAWIAVNGISEYSIKRGVWKVDIPLSTDANYAIPISYTDLAGNKAELHTTELPTKDTTLPTDLELEYSVSDPVNYKNFGYLFARQKMTVTASAKDATAGIHIIRFTITDENHKKTVKEKTFVPGKSRSCQVTIPLHSSDFKGTVKAEILDWSGKQIERIRSHIVESESRHNSLGKAVITTQTDPSRSAGDKDFYNTDVKLDLDIQDDYSGIGSYDYKLGSADTEKRSFRQEAGETLTDEQSVEIVNEVSLKGLTLSSDSNNENDVTVYANYIDNAGHEGHVEQLYNIDVTVPVITVEYDLNDPSNERFYNQTRTATVTIRERNFDADDVKFTITNTDGAMPSVSGWSSSGSGDDTKNVCNVVFSADGDYTFTVAFEDMAGNKAEYDRVDEFTIDRTAPELTVTYDNNQSMNEYYYAQGRTATIDILEHNFDPSLVDIVTTADGAGAPSVSGWSRNGDHNVATVSFHADGDYTFDISGMDQAENPLEEYETDRFVVDQTAPELEIFDIEDMSANNGIVMPGIRYYDTNYDANGFVILMKGDHNGVQEMNGTKTATAGGMEIKLNDFEHVPEVDDLYTMEATVSDLAGNSSEASVIFSVNRFGSVYTFDDKTELLVGEQGKYYTNEEQDIVVTETNVDTLEFREITCNLNGELRTMTEGEDYTVEASGTDMSWKQYYYTIDKSNFEEEGTYILTIYSEDRAANTSDNNTKGRKIEFVVDKTKPSVVISGVENGGQYRENSREVTLDVQDNVRMAEVEVTVNGVETTYTASQVAELDGKITFTVRSANYWQTLSVTAYDAAGNSSGQDPDGEKGKTEEISFLVTPNIFVQFFMNKILFYSSLAILIVPGSGIWWLLILGKKKKEEREE